MDKQNILFVIGNTENTIGGHTLSAITLAKYLRKRGYVVGLLLSPVPYTVPELEDCEVTLHFFKLLPGMGGVLTQPLNILKTVNKYKYDVIIAMDWYAALYSILAVIRHKLTLVQVIAGGEGPPSDPLDLPGIVVFSEELINKLSEKGGIPRENLVYSPGRVDFAFYRNAVVRTSTTNTLNFSQSSPKILVVSRLKFNKAPAISAFFAQLKEVAKIQHVQCVVIGDGDSRQVLEDEANKIMTDTENRADIRFIGSFRVGVEELLQADLVVGQGRTVLEAIACNVPAAVSGKNGYFGLITPYTFYDFASTNFTGRNLKPYSSLSQDLAHLATIGKEELNQLYELAYRMYDASLGAASIEDAINQVKTYYEKAQLNRWKLSTIWLIGWLKGFKELIHRRISRIFYKGK